MAANAATGITVNMTPSHPGDYIRSEIIEELDFSVTAELCTEEIFCDHVSR